MTDLAMTPPRAGLTPLLITAIVGGVFVLLFLAGIGFGSTWIPLETVANVLIGGGEPAAPFAAVIPM